VANKIKDRTGQRFGKLVVKEYHGSNEKKKSLWSCDCDCGTRGKVVPNSRLVTGQTTSCGCYQRDVARITAISRKKETGWSGFKGYLYNIKSGAKERNLTISLSDRDIFELSQKNCQYCGCPPANTSKRREKKGTVPLEAIEHSKFVYNGIDRLSSSEGYHLRNVVPCCWVCNKMKRDMSVEDFMQKIFEIYSNFHSPREPNIPKYTFGCFSNDA
jgi:hypothetical protein